MRRGLGFAGRTRHRGDACLGAHSRSARRPSLFRLNAHSKPWRAVARRRCLHAYAVSLRGRCTSLSKGRSSRVPGLVCASRLIRHLAHTRMWATSTQGIRMGSSALAVILVDSTALIWAILMRNLRRRFTFNITSGTGGDGAFTRACDDLIQAAALLVSRFRNSFHCAASPLRISESKDTSKPLIPVWLWFRSPHLGLAEGMMRTSGPPHW
jgi:hypothetical protein